MAEKVMKFVYEGKEIPLTVEAGVKREELYGKSIKQVEKEGEPLEKGILTPDGQLYPASVFGSTRTDSKGAIVESPTYVTPDGKQAPVFTSSFKEAREIKKTTEGALADLSVDSVIPVTQTDLPEGCYETEYTYRTAQNSRLPCWSLRRTRRASS